MDNYPVGVIHGRFQVLHNDHVAYITSGKKLCDHVIIGITNPEPDLTRDEPSDPSRGSRLANPLTYYERYLMVTAAMKEQGYGMDDFSVVPFPVNIPEKYRFYVPMDAVFFLSIYDDWGRTKKERFESLGLNIHVLREVDVSEKGISSTDVRNAIIQGLPWEDQVPQSVASLIKHLNLRERLMDLQKIT